MPRNLPPPVRERLAGARRAKGLRRLRPGDVIVHFVRRRDGARTRAIGRPQAVIAATDRLVAEGFEPVTRKQWLDRGTRQ